MLRPSYFALLSVACLCQVTSTLGVTRKYFIAANEVEWDYAPGGKNLFDLDDQGSADRFLKASKDCIGGKYMKAIYFGYTDATFTTQIPKPTSLGLLGPTIRAEVGDVIEIVYFNNASNIYSLHPHGVFYEKENEGALYLDGTSGRRKDDDVVFPGQKVNIKWEVKETDAPGPRDPNCIPWIYHSHVNTVKDTSAGAMGALITCRKGVLDANNERIDVDVDYPLLVKIFDENLSWLLDSNIKQYCLEPAKCNDLVEDDDFISSNYMSSINGYMFGHLPGLTACVGQKVQFYLIGMGNEFDVHSLYFHGMNLKYQHTRGDTVSVYTATFVAAETTPTMEGSWLISDVVEENEKEGMSAVFKTVSSCSQQNSTGGPVTSGRIRWYFLAAEEVMWDYGPGGFDGFTGKTLSPSPTSSSTFFENSATRIGGVYKKARYVQFSDSTYRTKIMRSPQESHMGIMGPVLRAEPGDIVEVMLKNNIDHPISFLPHGFVSRITDSPGKGQMVNPGMTYTFSFVVPSEIMEGVSDECLNFLYTSADGSGQEHHSGLVGQILICQKGYVENIYNQKKPKEMFLLLAAFDENKSYFIKSNIKDSLNVSDPTSLMSDDDFVASNIYFSVNGYSFGTLPGVNMCLSDNVTWYASALGSDLDVHPLTFDGNTFRRFGTHRDVQSLVAGSTAVLHMTPDNRGKWLLMSNSNLARDGGAYGLYTVTSCPGTPTQPSTLNGKNRYYYVAAEEVEWNYTPLERGLIDGMDLNDPRNEGNIFVKNDEDFIGNIYRKAVFREYTNSSFTTPKERSVYERHLDVLGPVLRAEVGDIITVTFMNKASRPFSMHAHGLRYGYADYGRGFGRAEVQSGTSFTYHWEVPQRSGPGPSDPNCISWLYYSALEPTKDINSGLMGPIVICRSGTLDEFGKRRDVHREMFVFMSVLNENLSWYLEKNIDLYASNRKGTDYGGDEDFEESNKMHSINGRLFGNSPDLVVEFNNSVTWYFMALGSEIDLHTVHTHGNTFLHTSDGHRDDVISMFPGMAEAVAMKAVNPGTWLLHCHVLDHIVAGMETTYTVLPEGESIPPGGSSANTHIG